MRSKHLHQEQTKHLGGLHLTAKGYQSLWQDQTHGAVTRNLPKFWEGWEFFGGEDSEGYRFWCEEWGEVLVAIGSLNKNEELVKLPVIFGLGEIGFIFSCG